MKKQLLHLFFIDICQETLDCTRGGYTDPNDCGKCRCPSGFGGKLCEKVEPSSMTTTISVTYI